MLNRADNPGLFQYAVLAYNKMASRENQLDLVMTRTLTDEQILSITELEIKPENIVSQFTNLKGLEQFKSLKKLTINGQDVRTNCSKYFGAIERWKSVGEETKERDLEYFKREYNSTQITDKDF